MDVSQLTLQRDSLNAHLATLIAKGTVNQSQIDNITAELIATDADVVAAIGNTNPAPLDFSAFDAAVAAFKTRVTAQSSIDALASTVANTN